jgi:hypothetical protein
VASAAPSEIVRVNELCRQIYQRAEHLCQPSESFDVRWEAGWHDLQHELAELESALHALR